MQRVLLGLVCAFTVSTITTQAGDWPIWRGPNANGMVDESGWNPKALANGCKILWEKQLGSGHTSASIRDGKLYTVGNLEDQDVMYCLDAMSGREIWTYTYDCKPGNYDGPRATPVLEGQAVLSMSRNGLVHALNADSGKVIWKTQAAKKAGQENITWGFASSPVVEQNLILLNIGAYGVALHLDSGKLAWTSPKGKAGYATPVVFDYRGKRCAAIFSADHVYVVDAATGDKLWGFPWKTKYDVNAADPVVFQDSTRMFISSGYGRGCALLDISGARPTKLWESDEMKNHFSTSIEKDGYLYGVDGNTKGRGHLKCLKAADGSEQWSMPIGFGSLIAAGENIIALGEDGMLYIANLTPEAYREQSKASTGLSKVCWTPPALSNGILYCRNNKGHMVAVDLR